MIVVNLLIAVIFYYFLPSFFIDKLSKPSKAKIIGIICVNNFVWYFIFGLLKIFLLNSTNYSEYITPAYMIWGMICYWTTGKKILKQHSIKQMTEEFSNTIKNNPIQNSSDNIKDNYSSTHKDQIVNNMYTKSEQSVHAREVSTTHQKVKVKVLQKKFNDLNTDKFSPHETNTMDVAQDNTVFLENDNSSMAHANVVVQETKTSLSSKSDTVNRLLILLSILLSIALLGILVWSIPMYSKLKEANSSLEAVQAELTNYESLYKAANNQKLKLDFELTDLEEELTDLKQEHLSLQDRYYEIAKENFFYYQHACVVPLNDKKYHTLECVYDDLGEFHIYNIEYAEYIGLSPHSCIE